MQKKFLRISVLTLVVGLSLLTTSHAMDPNADMERRIAARIERYVQESDACYAAWQKQTPGAQHILEGFRIVGPYSRITHVRLEDDCRNWWRTPRGVNLSGKCSGCSTLDTAVEAMLRDRVIHDARDFQ